jgi:hypothetical protein
LMDAQEVKERIAAFERAYYSQLRKAMARYPAIPDAFPYWFKGNNRIEITLARDGVIVVHVDAERDSFEFHYRLQQTVYDVMNAADEIPSVEITYPEDEEPMSIKAAAGFFELLSGEHIPAHEYVGWKVLEVIPKSRIEDRSQDNARERAEADIATFVNARLMGIDFLGSAANPQTFEETRDSVEQTRDKVIAELEAAINEFERVLDLEPAEEVVQIYLSTKRNKILLDPSAENITPKVKLGAEYVPDFVIQAAEGEYVLVEIERPGLPLLTKEGRLRAELTHAQQQVKDWFEWISRHSEYARSILPGIIEPKGWVIMGRRSSIPPEHRHVLARESAESRRITTQTYDDLLDRAKQNLSNLRKMVEP